MEVEVLLRILAKFFSQVVAKKKVPHGYQKNTTVPIIRRRKTTIQTVRATFTQDEDLGANCRYPNS